MTAEPVRQRGRVWINGVLCNTYYRGEVRYTGPSVCYIDLRSLTWTFWCRHAGGEFDTGCKRSDDAKKVVEAVGKLEGWL